MTGGICQFCKGYHVKLSQHIPFCPKKSNVVVRTFPPVKTVTINSHIKKRKSSVIKVSQEIQIPPSKKVKVNPHQTKNTNHRTNPPRYCKRKVPNNEFDDSDDEFNNSIIDDKYDDKMEEQNILDNNTDINVVQDASFLDTSITKSSSDNNLLPSNIIEKKIKISSEQMRNINSVMEPRDRCMAELYAICDKAGAQRYLMDKLIDKMKQQ